MKLAGEAAIITGAARGIGKRIALALAREGADLVLAGPHLYDLDALKMEIEALRRRVLAQATDVADEAQVGDLAEAALRNFGRVDILVNNASALGQTTPVSRLGRADWEQELAVNLTGPFLCSRAVLPAMMEKRKGKIINISSVAGQRAYPLRAPYAVSKWGLIGFTRTLAQEVGSYNIQVNAVAPGPVRGKRMEQVMEERAKATGIPLADIEREYLAGLALGRMVEEDDVARMVLFLASREADNITGQVFNVCSGYKL